MNSLYILRRFIVQILAKESLITAFAISFKLFHHQIIPKILTWLQSISSIIFLVPFTIALYYYYTFWLSILLLSNIKFVMKDKDLIKLRLTIVYRIT